MNPTEQFLDSLLALLQRHEKETGARIMVIDVKRVNATTASDIRAVLPITEIKLDMV